VDTVEHAEAVEKELNAFIERRSRKKDPDEEHELWLRYATWGGGGKL
jgi:hypothetical protein